jgi:hypothetical protein
MAAIVYGIPCSLRSERCGDAGQRLVGDGSHNEGRQELTW